MLIGDDKAVFRVDGVSPGGDLFANDLFQVFQTRDRSRIRCGQGLGCGSDWLGDVDDR